MTRALRSRLIGACLILLCLAGKAPAEGKQVILAAPEALVETGFLKYLLPRFSLKHGVRVMLVAPDSPADALLLADGGVGVAVFTGGGVNWHMQPVAPENPHLETLQGWLASDIGHRAIAGFSGAPSFAPPQGVTAAAPLTEMTGDAARGLELSLRHCGRCHVVGAVNRMKGVDNTPSYAVLRTLADWEDRFVSFFALNPHPWFTRLEGVSPPFEPGQAQTMAPVTLTQEELDDILAYAAGVAPADLGAPIKHQ